MSSSSSRTQNQQHSSTAVTNLNLQDTEGVTVAGSGNSVNVTQTDFGALDAARDFANSALDVGIEALRMGSTNLDTAAEFAGRGLDNALDATRGALEFGDTALGGSLDFARDIFEQALGAQANLAEDNLSGLTQLARQTSESADDRVTRTAMYAFAAIAAVFVLPALFGRAQ